MKELFWNWTQVSLFRYLKNNIIIYIQPVLQKVLFLLGTDRSMKFVFILYGKFLPH